MTMLGTMTAATAVSFDATAVAAAAPFPWLAVEARPDTSAWDHAHKYYCEVEANFDALCDQSDDASNAAEEAAPDRIARFFDDYKLGVGMNRESVEFWLHRYNGQPIDVAAVADEFDAYQRQILDNRKRFRTEELERAVDDYRPTYFAARDGVMEVPAPTVAALLVKMEISARSLDDEHAGATLADARRLLAGQAR